VSRSLRRGAVAALIIATAPVLAACSAGDGAATLQVKPNAAATTLGSLKLNGINVITATDGSDRANVSVNIANTSSAVEILTSVSAGGASATLSGPAVIPPQRSLLLSGPGEVSATVSGFTATPGQNTPVTFTFANAGTVTIPALVSAGTGAYALYAPAVVVPTPTASTTALPTASTPAGAASGKATPTGKATGKVTGKPVAGKATSTATSTP
jgi:hypothetical protein